MEKAERIDSVENSIWSREEVLRRFPEIELIHDEEIAVATIEYFIRYCPDYFFERAASASGNYHPPDERGKYGLWLHSKRVFYEYCNLSESLLELQQITEHQREAGKAAALIHDTFHRGWPSGNIDSACNEHDVLAAAVAKEVDGMPGETVHLIQGHMGPWGAGKLPQSENERCFHLADKSAAADNHRQNVYFLSEELANEFPELEAIGVENDEAPTM